MKHILLIICLVSGITLKGFSQQAAPDSQRYNFSIQDCINYAYAHQHDVINANLDVTSAEYHVKETIGQGLPQISGTASFQDYLKSPTVLFPDFITPLTYGVLAKEGVKDGNGKPIVVPTSSGEQPVNFTQKYNSSVGVTLNQILFDPNYIVGLQARKTYKELYDRSFTRSKIEASVNVTKAYYQVLVSAEQLKLLEANVKEIKQQLDETAARNKQGFVEKVDVDRLSVQYNSLVTRRENTIRLLGLNYQLLKFQMGMPVDKELLLKDKLEDIQLEASAAEAVNDTTVYRNRIEYNLLETQKILYGYDVKSKKGQFLPKLTANASYSAAYQSNSFGDLYKTNFPSAYIGLNLSIPIFTGFQHRNQLRQSEITVLKAQNDLDNMKNTVNLQVNQARISYINGLQTLNDQKKNMALAEEVLRVSKIKYEQGVGSSIEVTQAQTSVQDADNSYIQGLYDALVSKVDLDKAYGRIK
ncbi:MAG: TolC family protein [Bacteroidota bacterium]|nr:TolC family protein [Bacteroidota bacterium]